MSEIMFGNKGIFGIRFNVHEPMHFFIQFWVKWRWIGDFSVSQFDDCTRSRLLMIVNADIRYNSIFETREVVPDFHKIEGFRGGEAFDGFGLSVYRVLNDNSVHFVWNPEKYICERLIDCQAVMQHETVDFESFSRVVTEFDKYFREWTDSIPSPSPPYIWPVTLFLPALYGYL